MTNKHKSQTINHSNTRQACGVYLGVCVCVRERGREERRGEEAGKMADVTTSGHVSATGNDALSLSKTMAAAPLAPCVL